MENFHSQLHFKTELVLKELIDINTFFFADETKFSFNNKEPENSIYYFLIKISVNDVGKVNQIYDEIIVRFQLANGFHATKAFKEKSPNKELMDCLCNTLVENKLDCYCFKYSRDNLFQAAKKIFKYLNENPIYNFDNQEFQALFFLIQALDFYFQKEVNTLLPKGLIFFDRNVYGQYDIEAFNFENSSYFERMVFTSKKKIKLLGLPDYFGYIFRKSKISQNKVQFGDMALEKSALTLNSYNSLLRINKAGLFHFVDLNDWLDNFL